MSGARNERGYLLYPVPVMVCPLCFFAVKIAEGSDDLEDVAFRDDLGCGKVDWYLSLVFQLTLVCQIVRLLISLYPPVSAYPLNVQFCIWLGYCLPQ